MYLEISPRQCGKTHRMIKIAVRLIRQGKRVLFVTRTQRMHRLIQEEIWRQNLPEKGTIITFTTYEAYEKSIVGVKVFDFVFFDEFDFAGRRLNRNFILKNGYYATTPRFIRSVQYMRDYLAKRSLGKKFDLLVELIITKKYKFKTYYNRNSIRFYADPEIPYNEAFGCWRSRVAAGGPYCCEYPVREPAIAVDIFSLRD